MTPKQGPHREYSPEQLAIFARYKEQRASVRPLACQGGKSCWVELGPPALATTSGASVGTCLKCRGSARQLHNRAPVA
jgi:hypothetical protein